MVMHMEPTNNRNEEDALRLWKMSEEAVGLGGERQDHGKGKRK